MTINYREILENQDGNDVYILIKPFTTEEIKDNHKVHKEVKVFDKDTQDFKMKKIATLDGVNFISKSLKDFEHNGVNYQSGDFIFLNYNNNKYEIVDLKDFDINNDFERIDYFDFKKEKAQVDGSKSIAVDFFSTSLEVEYQKKLKELKEKSSIKIGSIKIS